MFKEFFSRELKGAFKAPMIYIFMLFFALLGFLPMSSDFIRIGGAVGNVYKNAPHIITVFTSILSLFGLLAATAFFNNAALRDYINQFNEILFSTPLSKKGYYFGRFFGALILSTLPIIAVYIGIVLGTLISPIAGWVEADRFGPLFLETFVNNYLLFVLPNMLLAGSIIYALSNKFKSSVISFVGTLFLIIGYFTSQSFASDIENEFISALLDPFGISSYRLTSKYWTPAERNLLSPPLSGVLLLNRAIWVAVGLAILVGAYFSFSFRQKNKKAKAPKADKKTTVSFSLPQLNPSFSVGSSWAVFVSFFRINLLSIIKSTTFKILFLFAFVLLTVNLINGFEFFGLQSFPLTYKMTDMIEDNSSFFVLIILVFFSGELIWRDRENHINEVIDSTPHVSFLSLIAKTLSLISITLFMQVFFIIIGILFQTSKGYFNYEIGLYIQAFVYETLPRYLVWAPIFVVVQVLVNQKYIGYTVSILMLFMLAFIFPVLDISTNMLQIGGGPRIQYSDMNGFGSAFAGAMWFNLYWTLFAFLLLMLSGFVWIRGKQGASFKARFKQFKVNFKGSFALVTLVFGLLWLGTASFVFYNTKVLNEITSTKEREQQLIDYENKYSKYAKVISPKITDAKYFIDIYPSKESTTIKAEFKITNSQHKPIDSMHFVVNETWNHDIKIPNSELVLNDEEIGYQIFKLNKPLHKGDTVTMVVNAKFEPKGFTNNRENTAVLKNGTFFNNLTVMPSFGYNERYEIRGKNDRKKHNLPLKDPMPKLTENCSDQCMHNYLTQGTSDWVNVETFISTSEDQVAIAPGSKLSEKVENGRRMYHYKVDHPSQNFYSFMSARYQVATRKWKDINIEVYYDAKHDYNIDMMLDAVEKSFDYYTTQFGPYYHKQARIIEFPRYRTFAQAFPGTMPYSESFGFIIDLEDEQNNVIDAVIAHEMAHQWWAHQEVSAHMQGGTMLTESFAEYSSLMVMKKESTPMEMKEFLKYDFNRYLRGRTRETQREMPLYKVENQSYIHYGKGSVVLYALQEYMGEENLNKVLKTFLNSTRYKEPPYPTSLDFLKILEREIPDSLHYLVNDWFKEITLYDLRITDAKYSKKGDNKFEITADFEARKMYADTLGNETDQPLKEWIDIGVLNPENDKELIYLKRVQFSKKEQTLSFMVDQKPGKVVIDPKRLLIERIVKDNSKTPTEI